MRWATNAMYMASRAIVHAYAASAERLGVGLRRSGLLDDPPAESHCVDDVFHVGEQELFAHVELYRGAGGEVLVDSVCTTSSLLSRLLLACGAVARNSCRKQYTPWIYRHFEGAVDPWPHLAAQLDGFTPASPEEVARNPDAWGTARLKGASLPAYRGPAYDPVTEAWATYLAFDWQTPGGKPVRGALRGPLHCIRFWMLNAGAQAMPVVTPGR